MKELHHLSTAECSIRKEYFTNASPLSTVKHKPASQFWNGEVVWMAFWFIFSPGLEPGCVCVYKDIDCQFLAWTPSWRSVLFNCFLSVIVCLCRIASLNPRRISVACRFMLPNIISTFFPSILRVSLYWRYMKIRSFDLINVVFRNIACGFSLFL